MLPQGYSQEPGDYDEVFAPVARYNSIRTVPVIANQLDLEVHQMDFKTAFLNGEFENEIYINPEGCRERATGMEDSGEIHHCLSMSIRRDRAAKELTISQKTYLENVLKIFGMYACKLVSTPMETGKKYEKLADGETPMKTKQYKGSNWIPYLRCDCDKT